MNQIFSTEELLHYSRHFNLNEIGTQGQYKLKQARVLFIGAGGLGSSALSYLAAAGVGHIGIVDHDIIEASNLQRQILYSYADIGKRKAIIAKQKLQGMNPHIDITAHDARLTHHNAFDIFSQYDIIADGSDNFTTRYIVNDACYHLKKPLVYASISRFEGQCTVFNMTDSACYRCLFDSPPPAHLVPNCAEGGVLGVLPGILGTIQATEVIKFILQIGVPLVNRLLIFNALQMQWTELAITQHNECRLCKHHQAYESLPHHDVDSCQIQTPLADELSAFQLHRVLTEKPDTLLIDVREPYEYDICRLNSKLIPLNTLPNQLHQLDKDEHIVLYCKHGVRSRHAMHYLRQHGFNKISHLSGGILAWIDQIDSSLKRY